VPRTLVAQVVLRKLVVEVTQEVLERLEEAVKLVQVVALVSF